MPFTVNQIASRELGAWTLSFYRMNDQHGQAIGVLVEIAVGGKTRSRLSASVTTDDISTIEMLSRKATAWISEYETRSHTGDTGFGELQ